MVTERDNYKMPELYTGEYTPEILRKKKEAHKKAMKLREKMDKIYAERKRLQRIG